LLRPTPPKTVTYAEGARQSWREKRGQGQVMTTEEIDLKSCDLEEAGMKGARDRPGE